MEVVRLLLVVLLAHAAAAACPSASYVDPYTSLPPAPVFPTATLAAALTPVPSASNPLTQNHWSETSNLAKYRPPAFVPTANPAQTNCPHLQSGLLNWHDPATWGGVVPTSGDVSLPVGVSVLVASCSIDPNTVFGTINIPATSSLIFGDAQISVQATGFNVSGSLLIGSTTCRLRNKVNITLWGSRGAQPLPAPAWVKGMNVPGTIDVHGAQYFPTWSRLAMTAKPSDTWIFIQDTVNWQPGQRIVVTTTELKDSRDWHRNEERTILGVMRTTLGSSVTAIQLDSPLSYKHFGGREYQAEVALESRNILIQGDAAGSPPTDTYPFVCNDTADTSTYPCENSYLTGFGAQIFVNGPSAKGRFSGVELFRVGQTNTLGRYPIHYHMLGNITASNYTTALVRDSSVHESYFRCFAIHGTSGAMLTQNTAFNAIGHCYFLEDGVEENNIISYNQAAHVHPLGQYWNPSVGGNGDSWWGQYLSYYQQTPTLLLPSDMAAGCFYITNTYNDFYGNAASGGFAGFSIPSLQRPVKLFQNVTNMSPANRPFRAPFAGNSAHSSGYWWQTAGAFYVGGQLVQVNSTMLSYTSGRSLSRDTCTNQAAGTGSPGAEGGCWGGGEQLWLRFEDNKAFLSNRGMQNWGNRAEIIRFELHDVSLAMNVFGQVWIDSLLMECRTQNHRPTWFNGCPGAGAEGAYVPWGKCNIRDFTFFNTFGGFQWYDVGQQHILTNSEFRNCRADWKYCMYGPSTGVCSNVAVFTSLTHSDQYVPELMQVTSGIKYTNVTDLWRYSTKLTDATGVTVSGRLQSWYDADGSASQLGVRAMIGSSWSNDWWKYNANCVPYIGTWKCPLAAADSAASLVLTQYNTQLESGIGGSICQNGGGKVPCPVVATASHFGSTNESSQLAVGVNAKITGPIIKSRGGWFIRYNNGTPSAITIKQIELRATDVLVLALPYPSGTTFQIWYQAASWCGSSWAVCRHNYTQVTSIAAVKSSFGDAYFFDNTARTLYMRVAYTPATFGNPGTDKTPWIATPVVDTYFSRGNQTLVGGSAATIVITASCTTNPCAPQPTVTVPAPI